MSTESKFWDWYPGPFLVKFWYPGTLVGFWYNLWNPRKFLGQQGDKMVKLWYNFDIQKNSWGLFWENLWIPIQPSFGIHLLQPPGNPGYSF